MKFATKTSVVYETKQQHDFLIEIGEQNGYRLGGNSRAVLPYEEISKFSNKHITFFTDMSMARTNYVVNVDMISFDDFLEMYELTAPVEICPQDETSFLEMLGL